MKKQILFLSLFLLTGSVFAKGGYSSGHNSSGKMTGSGYVNSSTTHSSGYIRKDGTYVAPYVKTSNNSTQLDNFETKGNTNPYTGKAGTKYASK